MTNRPITLEDCKSYATEQNLIRGLQKLGLDNAKFEESHSPCRYIICKTPDNRWTAIFLVMEYFNVNKTGGYVGFASVHGFISV